jgi:hypothetical protein
MVFVQIETPSHPFLKTKLKNSKNKFTTGTLAIIKENKFNDFNETTGLWTIKVDKDTKTVPDFDIEIKLKCYQN